MNFFLCVLDTLFVVIYQTYDQYMILGVHSNKNMRASYYMLPPLTAHQAVWMH